MLPICALIFASLCISRGDLEITNTRSMIVTTERRYSPEAVKRRGVEIDAMESDNFTSINGLFLNRACADGWCIDYTRHCTATRCKFYVGSPIREDTLRVEVMMGTNFEIRARNATQLRSFMKTLEVALVDQGGAPHAYLPLTKLDRETNATSILQCSSVVWYEGCPRPRMPMMKKPNRL